MLKIRETRKKKKYQQVKVFDFYKPIKLERWHNFDLSLDVFEYTFEMEKIKA
jgi:hypothetical protein